MAVEGADLGERRKQAAHVASLRLLLHVCSGISCRHLGYRSLD